MMSSPDYIFGIFSQIFAILLSPLQNQEMECPLVTGLLGCSMLGSLAAFCSLEHNCRQRETEHLLGCGSAGP